MSTQSHPHPDASPGHIDSKLDAKGKGTASRPEWSQHTRHLDLKMTFVDATDRGDLWHLQTVTGEPLNDQGPSEIKVEETSSHIANLYKPIKLKDGSKISSFAIHGLPTSTAKVSLYVDHPDGSLSRVDQEVGWASVYDDAWKVARLVRATSKTWQFDAQLSPLQSIPGPLDRTVTRELNVDFDAHVFKASDIADPHAQVYDLVLSPNTEGKHEYQGGEGLSVTGPFNIYYTLGPVRKKGEEESAGDITAQGTAALKNTRCKIDCPLVHSALEREQRKSELGAILGCLECQIQCDSCAEERRNIKSHQEPDHTPTPPSTDRPGWKDRVSSVVASFRRRRMFQGNHQFPSMRAAGSTEPDDFVPGIELHDLASETERFVVGSNSDSE